VRLLLDFGGVVIKTPFELLDGVGSPPWFGPFDPGRDPLWRAQQRGEITEREYWARRAAELYSDADPVGSLMQAVFGRPEQDVVRPEMAGLIDRIGRPAVLTNDLARFHDERWIATMGILDRVDPLIDLSFLGALKPSPEAFAIACDRLGEDPEAILLVDDQPANVAGAERFGMKAMWFDVTDPAGMVRRIEEALG
jgi:putative hydrolase of the HAD superfamily